MIDNRLKNLNRSGRKKGQKNRFTKLKEDFLWVFQKMGGRQELLQWSILPANRDVYYKMVIQLLPKELQIDADITAGRSIIFLPQRQFRDGQVVTEEAKQALKEPDNGDSTPLLEGKKT